MCMCNLFSIRLKMTKKCIDEEKNMKVCNSVEGQNDAKIQHFNIQVTI